MATCTGLALLDGREWQHVATRIGLAQLNGRNGSKWQLAVGLLCWMCQVPIGQSPPHVAHNSGGLTLTASMAESTGSTE